ncbi:unnamed protein product [Bursaphelenchus okinawaensis]|uniref:Diphosphomevalonate decarboxylase n=1 Tax=Bursaphelenchus okinawaensis TaxID=465554 RepID=A0A811K9B3_9BILA|nr:unnamed protein product [Bursaphelenchus okinawaensis]CAG9097030.1 unnamed protein product [Bursaphelenchus okinawaensis]
MVSKVTVRVPINIALIKYWGKKNEKLIIPCNDSVSLAIDDLYAETTVYFTTDGQDSVSINGKSTDLTAKPRFHNVFNEYRRTVNQPNIKIHVESRTNFTVAAGLASSAAGFAAIAFALGQLGNLSQDQTVRLARLGSGSACRSVLKGFVHWHAGTKVDTDEESTCDVIPSPEFWKTVRAVVFEQKNSEKDVPSTDGMQKTIETSSLFGHRVDKVVPQHVEDLKKAVAASDFEALGRVIIQESNQLHAVCLDTFPPILYLNDRSRALINFICGYNNKIGRLAAAYTFDAGPNCCVFIQEKDVKPFLQAFADKFEFDHALLPQSIGKLTTSNTEKQDLPLKNIFYSQVGGGPIVVSKQ